MKKKDVYKLYVKKITISNLNRIQGGVPADKNISHREECKSIQQICTTVVTRTENDSQKVIVHNSSD